MTERFDSKTVLITGGAQGIGRGLSLAFAAAGAHVVIVDIDPDAGQELLNILWDREQSASCYTLDVADEHHVIRLMDQLAQEHETLDVLINNAGVGSPGTIETRSMAEWDRVLQINLRAPYMMTKYCLRLLRNSDSPAILNIASTRALMSEANTEPYSASKGGILALTHSLAVSLGPQIRVNAISPGWIEVADWQKTVKRRTPRHSDRDKAQHPVGRVGTPDDIAQAALFLASPAAGFITGQNIVIDGGMTIKMIYEE